MDLYYLDELAARIKVNRDKIARLRQELADLDARMRDKAIDQEFARLIGYQQEDEDAESMRARINSEIDALEEALKNDMEEFINGLASSELIIPIDPRPVIGDEHSTTNGGRGKIIYKYRDSAIFTNFVGMFSVIFNNCTVKDIIFTPDSVVVNAKDEREARYRFVNSIREMQRMLVKKANAIALIAEQQVKR
ncbi:hypothetical protein HRbin04_01160 [archaeon HR04]|nr:hypothetical protein HRbin04_01160 [archaeon HR04]